MMTPEEAKKSVDDLKAKVKGHKKVRDAVVAFVNGTADHVRQSLEELQRDEITFEQAFEAVDGLKAQASDIASAIVAGTKAEKE